MESTQTILKILAGVGSLFGAFLAIRHNPNPYLSIIVWNTVAALLWIVIVIGGI